MDPAAVREWKQAKCPKGRTYWYNKSTKERSWKDPFEAADYKRDTSQAAVSAPPRAASRSAVAMPAQTVSQAAAVAPAQTVGQAAVAAPAQNDVAASRILTRSQQGQLDHFSQDCPQRGQSLETPRGTTMPILRGQSIQYSRDRGRRPPSDWNCQSSLLHLLPAPWKAVEDPASGKTYFYNTQTNQTSWTSPVPSLSPNLESGSTSDSSIPAPWTSVWDLKTGKTYYFNTVTKATSWEPPLVVDPPQKPATTFECGPRGELTPPNTNGFGGEKALPEPWKAVRDPVSGKTYYFNCITNSTSWDKPGEPIQNSELAPPQRPNGAPEYEPSDAVQSVMELESEQTSRRVSEPSTTQDAQGLPKQDSVQVSGDIGLISEQASDRQLERKGRSVTQQPLAQASNLSPASVTESAPLQRSNSLPPPDQELQQQQQHQPSIGYDEKATVEQNSDGARDCVDEGSSAAYHIPSSPHSHSAAPAPLFRRPRQGTQRRPAGAFLDPSSLYAAPSPKKAGPKNPLGITDEEIDNLRRGAEGYKLWRRFTPFLYEYCCAHALEWPSLTAEWLPKAGLPWDADTDDAASGGYTVHHLWLGTHAGEFEGKPARDHLMLCRVRLPVEDDPKQGHDREVNRCRAMPQCPLVLASKTMSSDVLVYDAARHPEMPGCRGDGPSDDLEPELRLTGHTRDGYGLSWSPHSKGQLLSGSDDSIICRWDINALPSRKRQRTSRAAAQRPRSLRPLVRYSSHTAIVGDVQWNFFDPTAFGSVGDDHMLMLWDTREKGKQPACTVEAHADAVNCMSFSPFDPHAIVTGAANHELAVWDARRLDRCVTTLASHEGEVLQVEWSPSVRGVLASAGGDSRICVWDTTKIGAAQSDAEADDGPPELLFIHGGHTDKVMDLSWNADEPWTIVSTAEDNIVHIWSMNREIRNAGRCDRENSVDVAPRSGLLFENSSGSADEDDVPLFELAARHKSKSNDIWHYVQEKDVELVPCSCLMLENSFGGSDDGGILRFEAQGSLILYNEENHAD